MANDAGCKKLESRSAPEALVIVVVTLVCVLFVDVGYDLLEVVSVSYQCQPYSPIVCLTQFCELV